MRIAWAVLALVAAAGCASPPPRSEPVLHDPTYHELPPAPPFVAKPVGAPPTVETIKHDVFAWTYVNALDPDTAKVEYVGSQAGPPSSRKEEPFVAKGAMPVVVSHGQYAGPVLASVEAQPTHVVAVWINGGQGFKPHAFHYLDGKLVKVE